MRSIPHAALLFLLVGSPLCRAEPPVPTKAPLALEDLYRLDSFHSLVLAPEARKAVCVRTWIDPKSKTERSALWLVEGSAEKGRPLEEGEPDGRAPVLSPDGKWLAFLSTRPRPDGWKRTPPAPSQSDVACDLWLLRLDGKSKPIPLAGPDKPYGRVFHDGFYGRVAFAPDGKRLAYVADDGKALRSPAERDANVSIVRPDQGEGYTGYGTAQLWIAQLASDPEKYAARHVERLTDDDVWYADPRWAADGKSLVVVANRTDDRESARYSINKNFDLWSLDLESHQLRQLTTGVGPEVAPRFAPDGRRLVCLSVPRKGSHRDVFNLAVITLGPGGARTEVVFDHHGAGGDRPPHPPATFPLPDDCWDGNDHVVVSADVGTATRTFRVSLADGKGAAVEESPRARLQRELLPPGNAFLKDRALGKSRVISWGSDGLQIEGILTTPAASVAKAPYPLVVYPHGGPHSRSAVGFDFTVQLLAAKGYAVLQPNYRGSSGYGQKFIDADRGDFGGGDMRDILAGIDHLAREKLIDPQRQFVYGTSYGGFMTCWLVGHTTQFRAAVAQNAVTDLSMMWALGDLQSWVEWEFGGRPWEVPGALRQHSPLTYASSVRTPTLVLHSREDRRCPLPMGRAFHQALRSSGVETEMVIFPGEGHGIRQPRHREEVLRRALAWFAKYDKKDR